MKINLFSGAGAGKTTLSLKLCHDLIVKGYSIELVREYIKKWAYAKRFPKSFDQLYIFGQQLHAEDLLYQSGVKHLVTDSPLFLQPFYAKTYSFPAWQELITIAKKYEFTHPSINIFLDRTGIPYKQSGRFETEQEAFQRDLDLKDFLQENNVSFCTFKTIDYPEILNHVEKSLQNDCKPNFPFEPNKHICPYCGLNVHPLSYHEKGDCQPCMLGFTKKIKNFWKNNNYEAIMQTLVDYL